MYKFIFEERLKGIYSGDEYLQSIGGNKGYPYFLNYITMYVSTLIALAVITV